MSLHVNVDYDEGDPESYRGIKLSETGGALIAEFTGKGPQGDWQNYLDWKDASGRLVLEGSSLTHFLFDVPGWRMIEDARGREIIVPEDRPGQDEVAPS
ncbi:MAG: hypothetical protein ABJN42_03660 [Roseibium sp.]|uniref:hypothetical protein n=1 Tax=Roseibium sp. TaxID=1936156 RepID=UPI0032994D16